MLSGSEAVEIEQLNAQIVSDRLDRIKFELLELVVAPPAQRRVSSGSTMVNAAPSLGAAVTEISPPWA